MEGDNGRRVGTACSWSGQIFRGLMGRQAYATQRWQAGWNTKIGEKSWWAWGCSQQY